MLDVLVNSFAYAPIFAVPLALGALGLIINERSGVLNLSAEGIFLCGALSGVVAFSYFNQNVTAGLIASVLAGGAFSVLFAIMVVLLRANQVVTGIMMVMFGSGLTGLLGIPWTDKGITGLNRLNLGILSEIPIFGPIFFRQDVVVYLTVVIVFLVWHVLHRTTVGMRLRAVGENPQAADASGINVTRYRFCAVVVGGMLVGLGGGYLTLASSKIWVADVTSGRGWIVVALVIFARWMPGRALFGAVLFGCIEALIPRIMTTGAQVPQYFLLSTPYLATLFVLIYAAVSSKPISVAPGALGIPYVREDRN